MRKPVTKPGRPGLDPTVTPKHFAAPEAKLWQDITREYTFDDPASLSLLTVALEALGRSRQLREKIDKSGLVVVDRFGQDRPNGLLTAERDARNSYLTAMRMLHLDLQN